MAEIVGETTSLTPKESIAIVELQTGANLAKDDFRLVVHFETGKYKTDGTLDGSTDLSLRVDARFGDIKNDVIEGDMTYGKLAGLIQKGCYKLRTKFLQDMATANAARAAAVAEAEAARASQDAEIAAAEAPNPAP